jgi:hypothetical protein
MLVWSPCITVSDHIFGVGNVVQVWLISDYGNLQCNVALGMFKSFVVEDKDGHIYS